MYKKERKKNFK